MVIKTVPFLNLSFDLNYAAQLKIFWGKLVILLLFMISLLLCQSVEEGCKMNDKERELCKGTNLGN